MTTPRRITPAGITALAAFIHTDLRPDWDRRGIAGTLIALADTAPAEALAFALIRGALDPTNETPAAIAHLNNHAWDSDGYPPCPTHGNTPRRVSGECAHCFADRTGDDTGAPTQRKGTPPPKPLRQLVADTRPREDA